MGDIGSWVWAHSSTRPSRCSSPFRSSRSSDHSHSSQPYQPYHPSHSSQSPPLFTAPLSQRPVGLREEIRNSRNRGEWEAMYEIGKRLGRAGGVRVRRRFPIVSNSSYSSRASHSSYPSAMPTHPNFSLFPLAPRCPTALSQHPIGLGGESRNYRNRGGWEEWENERNPNPIPSRFPISPAIPNRFPISPRYSRHPRSFRPSRSSRASRSSRPPLF